MHEVGEGSLSHRVGSKRLFRGNTLAWLEKWDEARHGELLEDRKCGFSAFSKKVSTLPSVAPNKY